MIVSDSFTLADVKGIERSWKFVTFGEFGVGEDFERQTSDVSTCPVKGSILTSSIFSSGMYCSCISAKWDDFRRLDRLDRLLEGLDESSSELSFLR